MIVLTSFDHRQAVRYGFPEEELLWLSGVLKNTPDGFKVLVLSHDAPLAELDYWASEIRNGEQLVKLLEDYQEQEGKEILAYIHGHTCKLCIYREKIPNRFYWL